VVVVVLHEHGPVALGALVAAATAITESLRLTVGWLTQALAEPKLLAAVAALEVGQGLSIKVAAQHPHTAQGVAVDIMAVAQVDTLRTILWLEAAGVVVLRLPAFCLVELLPGLSAFRVFIGTMIYPEQRVR